MKKYILHIHDIKKTDRFANDVSQSVPWYQFEIVISTFFKSEFHKMDSTFLSGFQTLRCDFISFQIQPLFEVPFENLSFRPTRLDPIHRHLNQSACYRSH